jgi:hypothetical protein
MKKSTKVLLGIASIWPVAYIGLFVLSIILIFAFAAATEGGGPSPEPGGPVALLLPFGFMAFFALHLLTIADITALKIYYIIHAVKNQQLDQNMRIMWILLFVFATLIAEPIFWYLYIWREPKAVNPPQLSAPGMNPNWTNPSNVRREGAYVPPRDPPDWR